MKDKLIHALSFGAKALSLVVGLKALPFLALLPPESKPALLAVFIFALASTVKEGIRLALDFLDDGRLNNSYKIPLLAVIVCLLPAGLLTSCAGWEVKFQESTGITPGQAVGILGETMTDYERVKGLNKAELPAQTSAKEAQDVTPTTTSLPADAPQESRLGWLDSVLGLWALFKGGQ